MDNLSKKQKLDDDFMVTGSSSAPSTSSSASSLIIEEIINPVQITSNNIITVSRAMEINTQNERIRRWQERQMARCIDENTINRVIELYLRVVHEVNSLNEPINIPQLLQSNEASNSSNSGLEESAILMAISEHGLQQGIASSSSSGSGINLPPIEVINEPVIMVDQQPPDCFENKEPDDNYDSDDFEVNESPPSSPALAEMSNENEEHVDFMEAAVAAAIQKKGLNPFAISMSPTR